MNFILRQKCFAAFFVSIVLLSNFAPVISYSVQNSQLEGDYNFRAYNAKTNNVKKVPESFNNEIPQAKQPTPILKQKQDAGGFQWGNLLGMALNVFSNSQLSGNASPIDRVDKISSLTTSSGEFSWTKIVSLGLQLILNFFGNDNVAMDKMDPGSPIEAFLSAIIAYFTGSNDPNEVSVMAKQATELWNIVISLLDTLKTSFSKRSFDARAIGSNDLIADAAIASTTMTKSFIKSYGTKDDACIQKYVCEANKDCADETSETGYLFCQMATYALSYALEGQVYVPFEIISDAGRMGRTGENCASLFKECGHKYF